jgi:serine/threonine protein kinase
MGLNLVASAEPKTIDLPMERPGTMIGRYKLLEKIGEGGFGVVYMAEQVEPVQRKVALKIIKAGMDTREVIARFETERQAISLMDHPNIARALDAGATEAGRPYFIMELVRGIPITEYSDQRKLPTRERLQLFIKVCQAVQHAHQKGVIHRDLKPSNVLITEHDGEPVPKVIDFGVAKALGQKLTAKTLFTAFNHMIGTPAYMSPEQTALSGLDIDTRADIYSLGVLLYELLTGVTPFDAETFRQAALDEIRRMIRETEPPKPSTRLQTLGEKLADVANHRGTEPATLSRLVRGDLDWIVMKCLEKDRQRRYETASGVAVDVARHLDSEPVEARSPSNLYRLQKLVHRHQLLFAASSVIAITLLLGIGSSTWLFLQERAAHRRALAAEENERALRKKAQTSELSARVLLAWNEGKLEEAESLQREALGLWRELLGDKHPQIATSLETLAAIVRDRGRLDDSVQLYKEALALQSSGEARLKQLNQTLSQGSYSGIQSYLGQSLPDAGARKQYVSLLNEKALSAARLGQWRTATADFTRLVEITSADEDGGHALVALLAHTGDVTSYRHHCAVLFQRFGDSQDPVRGQALIRDCLLLPNTSSNAIHLSTMSADLLARHPEHWASNCFQLAAGLVEFREERFAVAAQRLERTAREEKLPERQAQVLLLLAMSQYRLKQVSTAKATLTQAIEIVETKLPRVEDGLLGLDWVDWIHAHVLMREARLLVEND